MRKNLLSIGLITFLAFYSCSSLTQYHSMSSEEQEEYKAIAPKMEVSQRKTYLAKKNSNDRLEYLEGLGLFGDYVEEAAFLRMENEKREDFLKAYMISTPEERRQFLNAFNENTKDQIQSKDLQFGWDNKKVLLSLGRPKDILERKEGDSIDQLWIYKDQDIAFLYFQDGKLKDWAK